MDLKEKLKETWPKVRKRHLYPELPEPECVGGGDKGVGLDIRGKKISISADFVEDMSRSLEAEEVIEGLLDHAISHYLYCPWDFSTHLKLYREAKNVLKDPQMAQKATDYFMDVVADTHCVSQKETNLPKIYRHLDRGILDEAVHALFQKIWGVDLGVEGHEAVSRKLSRIPYMDRSRWVSSIRRFSRVIRNILEMEQRVGGMDESSPMGDHRLQQYSAEEIERGLQQLASESESLSEFKEIVEDFEEQLQEAMQTSQSGMGLGPGKPFDADILYYMKLSERYLLPLRKKPMEKSGSLYPHQHVPWEVGKPYFDIDPWTSFGKILPGITQAWRRREGEVFGREEDVPDCIILIDSSGSMTDPRRHLSHAVLGAACACDAYLRNDSRVAVYNFSDASAGGERILPFTRKRGDLYRTLCHYFGGGTKLLLKSIEDLQTDKLPDIFLITDMQITNLESLIEYFVGCKNRVTAVHVGENSHVKTFRRTMSVKSNVAIYAVQNKEDIPRIVLGKVREYLYSGK